MPAPAAAHSKMKTMTCKQLGGACEEAFSAETFEAMGELSKQHAIKMFEQGDEAHLKAAEAMKSLMQKPGAMEEWMANAKKQFDALPDEA